MSIASGSQMLSTLCSAIIVRLGRGGGGIHAPFGDERSAVSFPAPWLAVDHCVNSEERLMI